MNATLIKLGVEKTNVVPNKLMVLVSTLNTESARMAFAAHVMSTFKPAGLFLTFVAGKCLCWPRSAAAVPPA